MIDHRRFLTISAACGVGAVMPRAAIARSQSPAGGAVLKPLVPPAQGRIPVAFVLSDNAVMIDFAGPWEVFQDVRLPGQRQGAFELFTVAESTAPVHASAGMQIVPDHTFQNAPAPKVIIIPAQRGNDAMLDWIREKSKTADVTASVCTGAFILAKTGLLAGKSVTTHHGAYAALAKQFPDVHVVRGARFVDEDHLASSGGLSSGIDLALHLVAGYYGTEAALRTVDQMEYQGSGWTDPDANRKYVEQQAFAAGTTVCPVCGMDADVATAPTSTYRARTYYFCSPAHKADFDAEPSKWA